jgi:hypothetical protein
MRVTVTKASRWLQIGLISALAIFVLNGCGSDAADGKGIQVGDAKNDSNSANIPDGEDASDTDAPPDGDVLVDGQIRSEDSKGTPELPSDFNECCEQNNDCESDFCIGGPDCKVCTTTCFTDCPEGFLCEGVANFGTDITYICVPFGQGLCTPCENPSDCSSLSNKCTVLADEGSFCSRHCNDKAPCPDNYTCEAAADGQDYCFPTTSSCICPPSLLGQEETCFEENNFGICYGKSVCAGPGGWTGCNAIIPSAEVCDGEDNDCDGHIDEGQGGAPCKEENEWGSCSGSMYCDGVTGLVCTAETPAEEICDELDNDCDGGTDEPNATGCSILYEDQDKDGYGSPNAVLCLCAPTGHYTATEAGDCNDLNANVGVNATELCNGFDDNCDGKIDPENSSGCVIYYKDGDGDGFGDLADARCLCQPSGVYKTLIGGDCKDDDTAIYPGANESCNGADDNCNKVVDEPGAGGCVPYLKDSDKDSYGVTGLSQCLCAPTGDFTASLSGDCDDGNPDLNPAKPEICDSLDNNCNGYADEDCDKDNDGYCGEGKTVIGQPTSCPLGGGDCIDFDPQVNPGATEVCDGDDNNCNGTTDEAVQSPCGGCKPVCLMNAGPGGDENFNPDGGALSGTKINGQGFVVLSGGNSGTVMHTFTGWESGLTRWMQAGLNIELPDGTSAKIQVRTAESIPALSGAAWTPLWGPFPPKLLPVDLNEFGTVIGKYMQIKVELITSQAGLTPVMKSIDIVAAEYVNQ